jgi:hypothetical protein
VSSCRGEVIAVHIHNQCYKSSIQCISRKLLLWWGVFRFAKILDFVFFQPWKGSCSKKVVRQISQARSKIIWIFFLTYHDTARSLHQLQSSNFETQICQANGTRDAAWRLIIKWINYQAVHHNVQHSKCLPCKISNQVKSYILEPKLGFMWNGNLARRREWHFDNGSRTNSVGFRYEERLDISFDDVARKSISFTNQTVKYTSNDIIVFPETETRHVSVIIAK